MHKRRFSKKVNKKDHRRKPHWIYPGDLCWLKQDHEAFPANDDWSYNENILRILVTYEPIVYVRRTREGKGGRWVHHIECLGLKYVFHGSIHCFTKKQPDVELN